MSPILRRVLAQHPTILEPKPYVWRGVRPEDWVEYEQANWLARETYHDEKDTITWRYNPRGNPP